MHVNMPNLKINKTLDSRAFIVSQRLQRFYQTLNVVSALVSGLYLAVLSYVEFHPTQSSLARAAEGLLCSSATTAVISGMLSTMLLFRFEGQETATRKDLALAWTPLVLLDMAIVEYLLGLVFWYTVKNTRWRTALMSARTTLLLLYSAWAAFWMWNTMSQRGSLGKEERLATVENKRVADK